MTTSHYNNPYYGSQNIGNQLGDRPAVRQSKIYREHESGNQMKQIFGQDNLKWDVNQIQGAYTGKAYDFLEDQQRIQKDYYKNSHNNPQIIDKSSNQFNNQKEIDLKVLSKNASIKQKNFNHNTNKDNSINVINQDNIRNYRGQDLHLDKSSLIQNIQESQNRFVFNKNHQDIIYQKPILNNLNQIPEENEIKNFDYVMQQNGQLNIFNIAQKANQIKQNQDHDMQSKFSVNLNLPKNSKDQLDNFYQNIINTSLDDGYKIKHTKINQFMQNQNINSQIKFDHAIQWPNSFQEKENSFETAIFVGQNKNADLKSNLNQNYNFDYNFPQIQVKSRIQAKKNIDSDNYFQNKMQDLKNNPQ